jgi:hypothetical protein
MLLLLLACASEQVTVSDTDTAAHPDPDTGADSGADTAVDPDSGTDTATEPEAEVLTFYVDPAGDDAADGGLSAPWATLVGAQANLRSLRAAGALDRPVEVVLSAGTWPLVSTWTFGAEDGGTADSPVTWRAEPGEVATISGGFSPTGWAWDGDDLVVTLPEGTPAPFQLWVGGERRTLAREPDTGYYYQAGTPSSLYDQLVYAEGEVGEDWDLSHASVQMFHDAWGAWETSRLWVGALDAGTNTLTFTGGSNWGNYAGNRWWIEGVPEALDTPGEWFYDPDTRELRYRPEEGEAPETLDVVVPVLDTLVAVTGTADAPVTHLSFSNLSFAYTDWAPDADGYAGWQAAVEEGAAIEVSYADGITFTDSVVAHTGAHGIWYREGSHDGLISRCDLGDLGAGGVRFGTVSEADDAGGHTLDNSFLHHGGRALPSGQGVWIGQSSHNVVSHNHIADFYYTGVQVGWFWGYSSSTAEDNLITWNDIHTIGQDVLSDLGGVYTLGVSPGTEVSYNRIHDVSSYGYGGWGLYTDEGSSFVTLTHNVVYNAESESFHQHYGEGNVVTNNVLAYAGGGQVRRSREEDHTSFYFFNNIVYFDDGQPLYDGGYSSWTPGQYEMDYDVWWDPGACSLDWAGYSWAQWQALGNDTSSVVADPMFVDPENLDFTLDPASPAIALGFETWDWTAAGLYGDADWVAKPDAWGWTSKTHPASAAALADDFEATAVGDPPADAVRWGETADAWVSVVDTEAHGGSHSLEFQDQPGLAATYAPMIWYTPSMCGSVTATFAVKVEPGAMFYHEWRNWADGASGYEAGPSVTVYEDGTLAASWVNIGAVPTNQWLVFTLRADVGSGDGAWDLSVEAEDGSVQSWAGLPATALAELNWVGFVANGQADARLWLDDLEVR